jgi:hypothetical protein
MEIGICRVSCIGCTSKLIGTLRVRFSNIEIVTGIASDWFNDTPVILTGIVKNSVDGLEVLTGNLADTLVFTVLLEVVDPLEISVTLDIASEVLLEVELADSAVKNTGKAVWVEFEVLFVDTRALVALIDVLELEEPDIIGSNATLLDWLTNPRGELYEGLRPINRSELKTFASDELSCLL